MLLKLVLKCDDKSVPGATVYKWHKGVGDSITYGELVMELQVKQVNALKRPVNANVIQRVFARQNQAGEQQKRRTVVVKQNISTVMQLISSDVGFVRCILASEGTELKTGDPLAIISTESAEEFDHEAELKLPVSEFRVVTLGVESENE